MEETTVIRVRRNPLLSKRTNCLIGSFLEIKLSIKLKSYQTQEKAQIDFIDIERKRERD